MKKYDIERRTGILPENYSSFSDQEFATHLDLGYEEKEERKRLDKERREKLKNSRVHGRESKSDDEISSSKHPKI